jgi:hypothetical protein
LSGFGFRDLKPFSPMLPSPQTTREAHGPSSNGAAVRAQLQRLLAHPLFTNSKRYPTLLSYTVEQTLRGNAAELKERTIGIEAFGRKPDYDANADPVVRIAAAEVRKRLIQYYYDPEHAGELVIELSAGSYVPAFREPEAPAPEPEAQIEIHQAVPEPPPRAAEAPRARSANRSRSWFLSAAAVLLAGLIGVAIGRYRPAPPPSNFDRFWEPIVSSHSPVTYCLGEPAAASAQQPALSQDAPVRVSGRLVLSDVVTLARTIVPLVHRHGAFRVLPASETSFAQLREGPIVLIGAFDNVWTLRITQRLRFGFEVRDGVGRIIDRKNPKRAAWGIAGNLTYRNLVTDYAIIARIHDKMTGQPVIIVGGILDKGTEAASEVVYNPVYLDALLAKAPKNWDRLNLEAVLETHLIEGQPGPPSILAVETW